MVHTDEDGEDRGRSSESSDAEAALEAWAGREPERVDREVRVVEDGPRTGGMRMLNALLPPWEMSASERRTWSEVHPIRASLFFAVAFTPFVAAILLVSSHSWQAKLLAVGAISVGAFLMMWLGIHFDAESWLERRREGRR